MVTNHCPAHFILTDQGEAGYGPSFAFSRIVQGLQSVLSSSLAVASCSPWLEALSLRCKARGLCRLSQPATFSNCLPRLPFPHLTVLVITLGSPGSQSALAESQCSRSLSSPCDWPFPHSWGRCQADLELSCPSLGCTPHVWMRMIKLDVHGRHHFN